MVRQKVKGYSRYSKKKKKNYKVKKYTRKNRPKGTKLIIDSKPVIIKTYRVRDKYGHIITTTDSPIKFRRENKKRMLK